MAVAGGLIDTHVLLWALRSPEQLTAEARRFLEDSERIVYVSIASLWELSIKVNIGKIKLRDDFFARVQESPYELLPIQIPHLETLKTLPLLHRDPFDRLLLAQAKAEHLTLLTRDRRLLQYPEIDLLES
jgi:PIN domain nuclease of toxin-antitoxin system